MSVFNQICLEIFLGLYRLLTQWPVSTTPCVGGRPIDMNLGTQAGPVCHAYRGGNELQTQLQLASGLRIYVLSSKAHIDETLLS